MKTNTMRVYGTLCVILCMTFVIECEANKTVSGKQEAYHQQGNIWCEDSTFLTTVPSKAECALNCLSSSDCLAFNTKRIADSKIECFVINAAALTAGVEEALEYDFYTAEQGQGDTTQSISTTVDTITVMETTSTTTETVVTAPAPTPAPAPSPTPSSYIRYNNHDCSTGADLHYMNGGANDNQVCKDWCDAESNCGGFAFSFDGRCWFKDLSCVAEYNAGARYLYLKN